MDWPRILAYITGTVDQELLLRNEYLAAVNLRPNRASDLRRNGASSKYGFRDLEQLAF
jgi:hypothetical protein